MPGLVREDRNQNRLSHRDAEIEESVLETLRTTSVSFGESIACRCRDGRLVMTGTLPLYYLKQLAQESAGQVEGVHVVINQIQVDFAKNSGPSKQSEARPK
ncbi:BON domain protein [Symmachiella macrocystis]|uniref:BON domain protein n=1 Tax=Symmachiella macrocystis TaxID=2527985 RepID=A0A5C6BRK7_9PLAN|nr:BON domain-containing protein [Symmachiella macrocystis]TWU14883.1 BON domain protein [Symmachiella macrocystis]